MIITNYTLTKKNQWLDNQIGIELEFQHSGYSRDEIAEGIANEFGNKFIIKTDASFHNSDDYSEICTADDFRTSGNQAMQIWTQVVSYLNANYNASETPRTGFHIHHDCENLTPLQISNVITFYFNFERVIDLVIPSSRRSTEHVANVSELDYYYTLNVQKLARRYKDDRELFWDKVPKGKYNSLRISRRFQTLEFRRNIFTVDDRKLTNWIKFTQNLVKYCSRQKTFRRVFRVNQREWLTSTENRLQEKRIFEFFGKNDIGWAMVLSKKNQGFAWAFRQVFEYASGNLTLCAEFEKRTLKLAKSNRDHATILITGLCDYLEKLYSRI
ncbi:MAG: putative amidoligase enzyme [Prokaryotic dsDNA virus sp.]|jgi:hypothetical protein|nr:hypothetical protein [Candidatus Pacearchaeota archaeon]QDP52555.1 MAG: putative amidoligase enzyme [Prokaryotic dsDNA virus sp.]|tara:strand:+ start:1607 stop:2590 length:984 start_codon:yes stop_codon:yes gene_type:complete